MMKLKNRLLYLWNDYVCEGVNRRANRRVIKASRLWHSGNKLKMFYSMVLHSINIRKYGCEVYPQAILGDNFYMPHCIGIVIGNTAIIGNNCVVFPNVVIGARYSPNSENPKGRRHAKVGNNCIFGANSTIIGAITIGNNVTIGAGAIVTKDIPDNCTVVGNNHILELA